MAVVFDDDIAGFTPQPDGRKLFPSHRLPGWRAGVSAPVQFFLVGFLVGLLLRRR